MKAKAELKTMELRQDSFIRGYHVIWNGFLGQVLLTKGELATQRGCDRHAIVLNLKKHSDKTVGHLPIKLSRLCSMFIDQGGDIAL